MSLFSRAFSGNSEKRIYTGENLPKWSLESSGGDGFSHGGAMSLTTFFACTRLLADAVSSLPLRAYKSSGDVPLPVNPQPALLANLPYPGMSWRDWLWMLMESLAVTGNAYCLITGRDATNRVTALMPVHPRLVTVRYPDADVMDWAEPVYSINGNRVPAGDMVHIKRFPVANSLVGMSPIEKAANAIGLALDSETYGRRWFRDSANPSGVLTSDVDLNETQVKQTLKNWLLSHQNRRIPAVLGSGVKWQSISITPNESQFLETRQFQRSEIAMWFGVPPHMIGDTDKSTSWGCMPADALVFTANGPVPIIDVKIGDEVWSLGDNGMETAKVTGWQMTGHKPLLTIHTRGRELRLTSNHRVPVRRYFGKAEGRGRGTCGWETIEVPAGDIRPGDYLLVPHGMGNGDRDVAPNGRELTVGAMELCGLYCGDGSLDKNRIEIAHESRPDHMDHYRQVVRDEFGVEPYVDGAKNGVRTRWSSRECRELLECGFTGTSLTKRVPDWVFRLKPDLQLAFLRGYLDSDGSVQNGAVVYSSANEMLLEDVRHLCIQLGIPVGRVIVGRKAGEMSIAGGKTYRAQVKYQLSLTSLSFNSRIGSNSPRKASRFVDAPTKCALRYDEGWAGGNTPKANPRLCPGGEWDTANVVLHRVTKVDVGMVNVPVYDIEVAGPAHFVSDGVIVHNSGIEAQSIGFVKFTLEPWLNCIEQALSLLLPRGTEVVFDLRAILRGDEAARWSTYEKGRLAGVLSVNDIRIAEGFPPIGPEGDIRITPMNYVPLGTPPSEYLNKGSSADSGGNSPPQEGN